MNLVLRYLPETRQYGIMPAFIHDIDVNPLIAGLPGGPTLLAQLGSPVLLVHEATRSLQ